MPELHRELGTSMDRLNQAYGRLTEQLRTYGVQAEIVTAHGRVIFRKVGDVWRLDIETDTRGLEPLLSAPRQTRLDVAPYMKALVREAQQTAADMLSGVDTAVQLVDAATEIARLGKEP